MAQALEGITVLDLTRVVAGPYAGQTLGDLGADVIKVERRGGGDDARMLGPPWMPLASSEDSDQSTYFQTVNRNKRSLTIDFTSPRGAELLRRMIPKCDVLIENFRTGTLARYGLGYEDLRQINPALVYCSVTGFGQNGPYSDRSGYDYLIQAMGGVMYLTGIEDGEPGAGPMRVGVPLVDIIAGQNATVGILAALRHAERTGEGQHVDISLLDSQIAALLNPFAAWLNGGTVIGRTGVNHPTAAPYGPIRTADGHVLLATFNDREFVRVAEVLGHPEWATDPRFAESANRVANRRLVNEMITECMAARPSAHWIEVFNQAKVSCGPINSMEEIANDPQVGARDMVVSMDHPAFGQIRLAGSPLKLNATPVDYRHAPPMPGAHNREVLHELAGVDDDTFASLVADEIV